VSNKPTLNPINGNGQKQPELVIRIVVQADGRLRVENFPVDVDATLRIMAEAQAIVYRHFLQAAMEGKLSQRAVQVVTPDAMNMLPKMKG